MYVDDIIFIPLTFRLSNFKNEKKKKNSAIFYISNIWSEELKKFTPKKLLFFLNIQLSQSLSWKACGKEIRAPPTHKSFFFAFSSYFLYTSSMCHIFIFLFVFHKNSPKKNHKAHAFVASRIGISICDGWICVQAPYPIRFLYFFIFFFRHFISHPILSVYFFFIGKKKLYENHLYGRREGVSA